MVCVGTFEDPPAVALRATGQQIVDMLGAPVWNPYENMTGAVYSNIVLTFAGAT